MVVINSPHRFVEGADLEPLQLQGDCRCRIYHLRFHHDIYEFDDIAKLLKTFHPKTFELATARDLRKALAEIIKDLEEL